MCKPPAKSFPLFVFRQGFPSRIFISFFCMYTDSALPQFCRQDGYMCCVFILPIFLNDV